MTTVDQIKLLKDRRHLAQQKLAKLLESDPLRERYQKFIAELEAQIGDLGGVP